VLISLAVLVAAAGVQVAIFVFSDSVALLADLIHNFGDALTAVPLGVAFVLRSQTAERWAGYVVVLVIFFSACVALYETILRIINPEELSHLWALAAAGVVGFAGTKSQPSFAFAPDEGSTVRPSSRTATTPGPMHSCRSGSLQVPSSLRWGRRLPDPLIGLAITLVILKITWDSWLTVRHGHH